MTVTHYENFVSYEGQPRKVHFYYDRTGQTYGRPGGKQKEYAHTLCAGNFAGPGLQTTRRPEQVTCMVCQKHILAGTIPKARLSQVPETMLDQMAKDSRTSERYLEEADDMAHKMWSLAVFLLRHVEKYAVAIPPGITVGDVAEGQLALYEQFAQNKNRRW